MIAKNFFLTKDKYRISTNVLRDNKMLRDHGPIASEIELRRARQFATPVRKLQIAFKPPKAGQNRLGQMRTCVRLAGRLGQDRPNFGLNRPAVSRCSESEQFHDSIIEIPDGYVRRGDHPFLLSMLAEPLGLLRQGSDWEWGIAKGPFG